MSSHRFAKILELGQQRVYLQLAPDERFRAALEALWGRDGEELDRLNDTCAYETIRIQALTYFNRLRGFVELAMTHGISRVT